MAHCQKSLPNHCKDFGRFRLCRRRGHQCLTKLIILYYKGLSHAQMSILSMNRLYNI